MSSQIDQDQLSQNEMSLDAMSLDALNRDAQDELTHEEMDLELAELLGSDDTPPEAFYLALRQALTQLEHHSDSVAAA